MRPPATGSGAACNAGKRSTFSVAVGDALGVSDAVAEEVGEPVGVALGDSLGVPVAVAEAVGDSLGVALGDGVSVGDGNSVAEKIGDAVGTVDGVAVGATVTRGDAVGVLAAGAESLPLEQPASNHAKARIAKRVLGNRAAIMSSATLSPVWPYGAMNYKADVPAVRKAGRSAPREQIAYFAEQHLLARRCGRRQRLRLF